jgi:transcriptional regulator with XRE-family HTH domain
MIHIALKYIRQYFDIKQVDLAAQLEISKSYLSEIESGKKKPSLDMLDKYSKLFKIPVSLILVFSEKMESKKISEKARVYSAQKILKLLESIIEKDKK